MQCLKKHLWFNVSEGSLSSINFTLTDVFWPHNRWRRVGVKLHPSYFFLDRELLFIDLKLCIHESKKDVFSSHLQQICSVWFYFTLLVCDHFCNEIGRCQLQKSLKYFSILLPMKSNVRFEYVRWKTVWFCFISIVWVQFSLKTEKFKFWKSLKYFNNFLTKKYTTSDLNMFHEKSSDFVSFPLFGFALVIKLRDFDFESYWNTFFFFWIKKNDVRFDYVLSNSVWFGLSFVVWVEFWHKFRNTDFYTVLK